MPAKLLNLGPASEAMLRRAGIATERQLRELGAVRTYARVVASGARPSLNLLWALEGALTGRSWQEVARSDRLGLLMQLEREDPRSVGGRRGRARRPRPR